MQSVIIRKNQAGQRLDKFLHKYLPNADTGFLYKMLRKKNITLNGKKAAGSEKLEEGDCVDVFFSRETFEKFTGRTESVGKSASAGRPTSAGRQNPAGKRDSFTSEYERAYRLLKGIQVLYEDDDFLFLNKPAGILTQKAKPEDCSLNEWMIGYLLQGNAGLAEELHTFRPSVCNRLDRNTSGIVLCGKSLAGLQFLSRYIKERSLRKFYHTICVGELREAARIQGYLRKDGKTNKVSISGQRKKDDSRQDFLGERVFRGQDYGRDRESAQDYIETSYVPLNARGGYTYLEVELITGKPHQIRAHLASMGHPLIGDFKYGEEKSNRRVKREFGLQHQLLHACRIVFPETAPGVGAILSRRTFTAPEPELFLSIKASLEL